MIRVERLTSVDALGSLEKPWADLVGRTLHPEPYLTHEWITLWCRHFGEHLALWILAVEDDGRLIGVAPLMVSEQRRWGMGIRRLGFLLNGCSVRSNLIVDPARSEDVCAALVEYWSATARHWDVLDLCGISEQSGVLDGLRRALDRTPQLFWRHAASWDNAMISLEGRCEQYLKARGRHFRKRLAVTMRDLAAHGDITLKRYGDAVDVDTAMKQIFDIERRSWKVEHGDAMVARTDYQAFYREMVSRWAARGAWRAWILEIAGTPVASHFGCLDRGVFYAEKQSYDAAYAAVSPGKAVFGAVIEDLFRDGVATLADLDRQTAFSEHWATHTQRYHHLQLFNRRPYSHALYALKRYALPRVGSLVRLGR